MSEIPISDIKIGKRFRKNLGDIKGLAKNIEKLGLLHPIIIDDENNLIAGYRRIKAFQLLGRETIPFTRLSLEDIKEGEIKENVERKDFTPSEMVDIKRYLEPQYSKEAEKRKKASLKKGKEKPRGGIFPPRKKGKTRDKIGEIVGISGKQLEKIEDIVEAAEENPEKFGELLNKVDSGKTSVKYAHEVIIRAERHSNPPPLPDGKFDVIYADPPWDYNYKSRGAENHYSVLNEKDLIKLPIPSSKDSILFMWATNAKLKDALQVLEGWGYEYKTNFVWVKDKFGTGHYVRGKHELLLIGKKGEIPTPEESTRPESIIEAEVKEHSQKPEIVYKIIESMYPNRKYLELFARNKHEGWASWGDEI